MVRSLSCLTGIASVLNHCRTLHPARLTSRHLPDSSDRVRSSTRDDDLAQGYRNIVGAVLKRHPGLLNEFFSVHEFALLQTNAVYTGGPVEGFAGLQATESLQRFFDYLMVEHGSPSRPKWELPMSATDFIEFLKMGSRDQLVDVVDFILSALRPFGYQEPLLSSPLITTLLARPSELTRAGTSSVHPALPFLWFTCHLLLKSRLAVKLLEQADFLVLLESVLILDSFGSSGSISWTSDAARDDMQSVTCMILGVLSARSDGDSISLPRRLKGRHPRLFCHVFLPFIDNYNLVNSFRLPICDQDPPDDRREFYEALLEYLR